MMRTRCTQLATTLLLAALAWSGVGVPVLDAVLFHRLAQGVGHADAAVAGVLVEVPGHRSACAMDNPLPTGRIVVPAGQAALVAPESLVAPLASPASCRATDRLGDAHRSRAPPILPA